MKTLEFAVNFTTEQKHVLHEWLELLRWTWNEGLRLCQEFEKYAAYYKQTKSERYDEEPAGYAPCCPRFGEEKIRWYKNGDTWVAAPYSSISTKRNPTRFFCPLPPPKEYRTPKLPNISEFSLAAAFTHKKQPRLASIPANFIRGVTQALAVSWKVYKKGDRGEPRFKGRANPLETLSNNDAKILRRDGDRIKIPNLGWIKLQGLNQRWKDATICSLRLIKRASGWVAQLSGYTADDAKEKSVPIKEPAFPKPSQPITSVALICKGGGHHATDKKQQSIQVTQRKEEARLLRLQRKLARQQYLSNGWQRTKMAIAKLYEKIRLRRRNLNHKLSTFLVRTYATLIVQKIKPGAKKRPEPIPINTEPPQWAHNGAQERSRKNRMLSELGQGQFVQFIKQKAAVSGRKVVEVVEKEKLFGIDLAKKLCGNVDTAEREEAIALLEKLKNSS